MTTQKTIVAGTTFLALGLVMWWVLRPQTTPTPQLVAPSEDAKPAAGGPVPPSPTAIPGAAHLDPQVQARLQQPEARRAGEQAIAWFAISRELTDGSLKSEAEALVRDLREARKRIEVVDLVALADRQDALRARILQGSHRTANMHEPFIQLDRLGRATSAGGAAAGVAGGSAKSPAQAPLYAPPPMGKPPKPPDAERPELPIQDPPGEGEIHAPPLGVGEEED